MVLLYCITEQLVQYLEKIAEAVPDMPLLYYEYNITTGVYCKSVLTTASLLKSCALYIAKI